MPSPTGVTETRRKRKRTKIGKARKREDRKRGTINYFTAFGAPAEDDKQAANS